MSSPASTASAPPSSGWGGYRDKQGPELLAHRVAQYSEPTRMVFGAKWTAQDPRWPAHLLDTTGRPAATAVDQLERWVTEQRDAHRAGQLPLRRGWAEQTRFPADHDT